ncbi:heme peroxidase [Setomelanomma holmii]|uniref:Peroxidase n=1 Tax=Setomelanomma holmii TaxID=210430 RepID=A0A9P4LR52_9PLEO|nr:heme peroxidase [Setomelanomma holmii]
MSLVPCHVAVIHFFHYLHLLAVFRSAVGLFLHDLYIIWGNQPGATCPAVWNEISTTLTAQFLADGQCTDAARAAIRGAFHDCFNGACDGSLILANECTNTENRGLERLCTQLGGLATEKQVGVADLIQFAAAHAIKTCPGGPTVPVKVGRKDSSTANALGVLPAHNAAGGDLVKLFASKGFSPIDLAALIGAHTAAKQRTTDPSKAGAALDSTVGTWDNKYYQETKSGKGAPFTLEADKNIAQNPLTTVPFSTFAASKSAWDFAFVSAMTKMSMLGVDSKDLIDCTSALPGGSSKREIKGANLFDRLKW